MDKYESYIKPLRSLSTHLNSYTSIKLYVEHFERAKEAFGKDTPKTKEWKDFKKLYTTKNKEYKELKVKLDSILENLSYTDLVQIAYFRRKCPELEEFTPEYRSVVRNLINPSGDKAFLNLDGETVYQMDLARDGSFKRAMSIRDARSLCEHYEAGTLKHGQKYGDYVIMGVYSNDVRISCGLYPNEMVESIYKQIKEHDEK